MSRIIIIAGATFAAITAMAAASTQSAQASDCSATLTYTGAPEYKGEAPNRTRLCREGYVEDHDTERKVAVWVLEVLTQDRFQGPGDRDAQGDPFAPDPDLTEKKRAELNDYKGSNFDRGHMASAGEMKFSKNAMRESFYLSNTAPRIGIGLNRHIWAELEKFTREWTCERGKLIAITGPIFDEDAPGLIGANKVGVPSAFFKILYDPSRRQAIAFILPNRKVNRGDKKYWDVLKDEFRVSIMEIEARTGLDFLTQLLQRDERRLEQRPAAMWTFRKHCPKPTSAEALPVENIPPTG